MLAMLSFIVSMGFQLYVANTTALKGKDFMRLYNKKEELNKEIAYLKYLDSTYSSMAYVEKEADRLGFVHYSEPLTPISLPALASLNQ